MIKEILGCNVTDGTYEHARMPCLPALSVGLGCCEVEYAAAAAAALTYAYYYATIVALGCYRIACFEPGIVLQGHMLVIMLYSWYSDELQPLMLLLCVVAVHYYLLLVRC